MIFWVITLDNSLDEQNQQSNVIHNSINYHYFLDQTTFAILIYWIYHCILWSRSYQRLDELFHNNNRWWVSGDNYIMKSSTLAEKIPPWNGIFLIFTLKRFTRNNGTYEECITNLSLIISVDLWKRPHLDDMMIELGL